MTVFNKNPDLSVLLSEARRLRPYLLSRHRDLDEQQDKGGNFLLYAVDTNIIYFIVQSFSTVLHYHENLMNKLTQEAYLNRESPFLGSIFASDPIESHITIGATIAKFVGFELSKSQPLFLPTALWPEIEKVFTKFDGFNDADDEEHERARKVVSGIADKFIERVFSQLEEIQPLSNNDQTEIKSRFIELISGEIGARHNASSLERLFRQGRIHELGAYPIRALPNELTSYGDLQSKVKELEKTFRRDWETELLNQGKQDNGVRSSDVEALTQIQIRNYLARANGIREKVLYLTLDSQVINAAFKIKIDDKGTSFGDEYLRHPMSFLDDIGLGMGESPSGELDPRSTEAGSILDYLDTLLALDTPSTVRSDDIDSSEADNIRESWSELSGVQDQQLFAALEIDDLLDIIGRMSENADLSTFKDELAFETLKREADAWTKCFNAAISIALRRTSTPSEKPTRIPPQICFEGWAEASVRVEQFKLWGVHGGMTQEQVDNAVKILNMVESETKYAFYLASAAFFAARGDWRPAAGLSAFARTFATWNTKGPKSGARGREALFFEAVSRRYLAKNATDLDRVERLLHEARRVYRSEIPWRFDRDIVSERFDFEELEVKQTRLMFSWSEGKVVGKEAVQLLKQYYDCQESLENQVDDVLNDENSVFSLGSENYALVQTEMDVINGAFLLAGVGLIPDSKFPARELSDLLRRFEVLQKGLCRIETQIHQIARPDESFQLKLARVTVRAIIKKNFIQRHDLRELKKALSDLRPNNTRRHEVFPFDRMRYDSMLSVIQRILDSSQP